MNKLFQLSLFVMLCFLFACKPNFDADIEAIKKSPVPTNLLVSAFFAEVPNLGANTIEAGIAQLAGVAGSAKWEASRPEKYKDNPDVVSVQVEVKSVSDKGNHTVKFQWLLNRKSKQSELQGFEVDGKKQSMIDAVMALKLGVISQDGSETPKGDEPSNSPLVSKSDSPVSPMPQQSQKSASSEFSHDNIKNMLLKFMNLASSKNFEILNMYADKVNTFNGKLVGKSSLKKDEEIYFTKWNNIKFELLDNFVVSDVENNSNQKKVVFRFNYQLSNAQKNATGTSQTTWILESQSGQLKIIDQKETIVRKGANAASDTSCLQYEPTVVDLKGVLREMIFPGPPNYESIKAGDTPEHCLILYLKEPICVQGNPTDDINSETARNVMRVHLAPVNYKKPLDQFIGKNITARGTLFAAHTGHHRTPVLLSVTSISSP